MLEKDPSPLTGDVPAELGRIVLKAMAKDPDERYQTAKDMLIDLRSLKRQLELKAEIERTSSPSTERVAVVAEGQGKKRVLLIALGAMLLVTAAIFAVNVWRSSRQRPAVVTPVPAPAEERTLTYWITVQKFKNNKPYQKPFTLGGEINFEASYQIRVNVRSPQPGYLYVVNEGPGAGQPEFVVLFPSSTANQGSPQLAAGQLVQIPEESWFAFDAQQGVEKLWLIFSADAVPELEAVKQFANRQTKGLIRDVALNRAVQNFLNTASASKPNLDKTETLTTLKAPGKFLVYPIKLEHH